MKASESRFTIDMAHITGPVQSFPINLPSGKKAPWGAKMNPKRG